MKSKSLIVGNYYYHTKNNKVIVYDGRRSGSKIFWFYIGEPTNPVCYDIYDLRYIRPVSALNLLKEL
jgi:hypothetical protein